MKKAVILLLFGALLACAGPARDAGASPVKARPVKMFELRHTDERQVRVLPGEIRASERVELSFRVQGTLQEVLVVRGSRVKTGDLIAVLDKRDLENDLMRAQSELHSAEAQLSAMRTGARREDVAALTAQVSAARARYNEARVTLERHEPLLKAGGISQAQFDRVKTTYDVEREGLNVAEQNLARGRAGSRPEEINMQEALIRGLTARVRAAQDALDDAELRAPFDGTVAEIYVDNFQSVQRNQTIAALQDIAALEVAASMPGSMALNLSPERARDLRYSGDRYYIIQARFPSLPDRLFNLQFKEIATRGNVQTQTYDVALMMETPDDLLILPGMGIDVLVSPNYGREAEDGFAIPFSALAAGEGGLQHVWKAEERDGAMTVRKVEVTVIGYLGDRCVVSGDLTEGERIAAAGLSYLRDGDAVTPYISPARSSNAGKQP